MTDEAEEVVIALADTLHIQCRCSKWVAREQWLESTGYCETCRDDHDYLACPHCGWRYESFTFDELEYRGKWTTSCLSDKPAR